MPSASTRCFVDTNVLIYTLAPPTESKKAIARTWVTALHRRRRLVISPQVVNEFCSVALRKGLLGSTKEISDFVARASEWCTAKTTPDIALAALKLRDRYPLQWFDALLLASALDAGCGLFLSEDMSHGQIVDGLEIVSPFALAPEAVLSSP